MSIGSPSLTACTFVQIVDFPSGACYGPRTLSNYELVWVLGGSAEWHTRPLDAGGTRGTAERHELRPGALALARKGSSETYYWSSHAVSRHAYVHFDIHDTGRLGAPWTWPSMRDTTTWPLAESICSHLLDLSRLGSPCSRRRSDELVGVLVDLFVAGPVHREAAELHPAIRAAVHHVALRWRTDGMGIIPISDLAAAADLSTGHLHHLFREQFHVGPARALELIRLARAASRLQRSNTGLGDIAHDCGFANPYHFSRRFAMTYDVPPGVFRQVEGGIDPLDPVRAAGLQNLAYALLGRED